jgi:hypothetical protein
MKNSNDTIGNRTHDLPTRSAVPQPTVLPHAPEGTIFPLNVRKCYLSGTSGYILNKTSVTASNLSFPHLALLPSYQVPLVRIKG